MSHIKKGGAGGGPGIDGASINHDGFTTVRDCSRWKKIKTLHDACKSVGHLFSLLSGRTNTYIASLLVGGLTTSFSRPSTA